jgi:facilitated trehalose transporter
MSSRSISHEKVDLAAPVAAAEPRRGPPPPPPAKPTLGEDPNGQDATMVDWSKPMRCGCCGCFSYLLQLILTAASGSFLFGINLSLLNTSLEHIGWELEWCSFQDGTDEVTGCNKATVYKSFLSVAVFVGAAIGSMSGGVFLSFGRRGMILLSMAVFVFGVVSQTCANSFSALVWARLVCGYAVGLVSVCVPIYMSEVTPAALRGFYGVFHQLFITIGILVGTLIGLPLALSNPVPNLADNPNGIEKIDTFSMVWWRVMLGLGILPVLLTAYLMGVVYKFETPHYYIERKKPADAEMLLRRLTQREDVSDEMERISKDIADAEAGKAAGMSLSAAMSRPDYRWVIFFGCLLSAFQQFGGINVFIASSNRLFQEAGLEGRWPTIMSNIMNLINCVMTLPAVPLIEKMGRRTLMVIGTAGMTIGVAPAAICYWALEEDSKVTMWLAIIGCLVFIICFAATYGPILWVYLFEIYPTEIKGAASGLATAFNWIAGIVMVFVTAYLDNKVSYLIFLIMCGISFVIIFMWMKETKGRQLGDSPYINQ